MAIEKPYGFRYDIERYGLVEAVERVPALMTDPVIASAVLQVHMAEAAITSRLSQIDEVDPDS